MPTVASRFFWTQVVMLGASYETHAVLMQSTYRGHRCRSLLSKSMALPDDVWGLILEFIQGRDAQSRREIRLSVLVGLRIVRAKHMPDYGARTRAFSDMTRLARKYKEILTPRARYDAFSLAKDVIFYDNRRASFKSNLMANALLEDYAVSYPRIGTCENAVKAFY